MENTSSTGIKKGLSNSRGGVGIFSSTASISFKIAFFLFWKGGREGERGEKEDGGRMSEPGEESGGRKGRKRQGGREGGREGGKEGGRYPKLSSVPSTAARADPRMMGVSSPGNS
jgi:hypothetical protein